MKWYSINWTWTWTQNGIYKVMYMCSHEHLLYPHCIWSMPLWQTTATLTRPSHPCATHTAGAHCYYRLAYEYIRMYINNLIGAHTHTSWLYTYTPSMEEAYTKLYNITSCIEPSDGEVYKRPFTTPMSPGKMADLHSLRSACGPQWDYHLINQGSAMSHNYALDDMLQMVIHTVQIKLNCTKLYYTECSTQHTTIQI